ncbi:MAG TPA: DotU family type IV/VI secretion system protein [Pirellulaceae bacterium]|nr:DotU family type IV/VI secretion system protein [Pirellulaceae bacterium]
MTPKHSLAVDPLLLHMLGLLDRIADGQEPDPTDERIRMRALLDQGEAIVGAGREWELTKYALVSWIDEMLVETSWNGREYWSNNVLEMDVFRTRLCNEQFFEFAKEASTLTRRDALEVYYVCVVLGFRGLYRDPNLAAMLSQQHGLPLDLATWARQVAMSIRLGQGRPPLAGPKREVTGAPPLKPKDRAVWPWLLASMLAAWNIIYAVLYLR